MCSPISFYIKENKWNCILKKLIFSFLRPAYLSSQRPVTSTYWRYAFAGGELVTQEVLLGCLVLHASHVAKPMKSMMFCSREKRVAGNWRGKKTSAFLWLQLISRMCPRLRMCECLFVSRGEGRRTAAAVQGAWDEGCGFFQALFVSLSKKVDGLLIHLLISPSEDRLSVKMSRYRWTRSQLSAWRSRWRSL